MKILRIICRVLTWISMFITFAMMVIMVLDVLARALFGRPVRGITEWAQILLVCSMVSLGVAILSNYQIKVNMITAGFSPKAQVVLDAAVLLVSFAAIVLVGSQQIGYAIKSYSVGTIYNTIKLPEWPFIALFGLGYLFGALCNLAIFIRKVTCFFTGDWQREAKREDMDEILVYGNLQRVPGIISGDVSDGNNLNGKGEGKK